MGKENLTFRNIETEKKMYRYMTPLFKKDIDLEKVLVSNKISFGEKSYKYFIGYLYNDHKVEPLNITLM